MREPISWEWLGLCAYEEARVRQEAAWTARRDGGSDVCLALEHPPTITLGRRGDDTDVLASEDVLRLRGFEVHATERGGRATYHGPGQLVLYPIVHLAARGLGVERFVWLLEGLMLELAAVVGVSAHRDPRGRGIWTARGKLGAVGIRVREGISMHGLALNVSLDLSGYDLIAPCGVRDLAVTSLRAEGVPVQVLDLLIPAQRACLRRFSQRASGEGEEAFL
jgi:lipoate-protein ligase B